MKPFAREFSTREKALLAVLFLLIAGALYFTLVDTPVRAGLESARAEEESLEKQLETVQARVADIQSMKSELGSEDGQSSADSRMPSYNASNQELDFLHRKLGQTKDYYIGFNQVTREGDQIRRDFSLQFRTGNYQAAVEILRQLERSELRCLIGDMSVAPVGESKNITSGAVAVSCTATFYETMYGGKPDAELPVDEAAQEEEVQE